MTRGDASGIGNAVRAHIGHWAIAEENGNFLVLRLYHTAGGCKGWKQLHCAITRGELDKAAEVSRDEKGDAACDVRQSVSRASQGGMSRVVGGRGTVSSYLYVNVHQYVRSSSGQ